MDEMEFEGNYVKGTFLRRVLGFKDVRRVQQLAEEGVLTAWEPADQKGRRGKLYDLCPSVLEYIEYLRSGERNKDYLDKKEQKMMEKMQAEIDYKNAKARMAEIELDELEGRVHASEDVEDMTADLCLAVRSMLLALPGQLAVDVAAVSTAQEAQVIIKDAVFHILDELSRYGYDPKEYRRRVLERKEWEEIHGEETES